MDIELNHILLFIHLVSLVMGFGAVMVIDTFGLLWLLKKVKLSFVQQVANTTQPLIWIGWSLLVITGIPLIVMKGGVSGLSMIKIFAVLLLGVNGVYLHIIKKSMDNINDNSVMPSLAKFRITLASFISQAGWWTAIVIGFLNNKLKTNAPVVDNPYLYIIPILVVIVVVGVVGELIFKKK